MALPEWPFTSLSTQELALIPILKQDLASAMWIMRRTRDVDQHPQAQPVGNRGREQKTKKQTNKRTNKNKKTPTTTTTTKQTNKQPPQKKTHKKTKTKTKQQNKTTQIRTRRPEASNEKSRQAAQEVLKNMLVQLCKCKQTRRCPGKRWSSTVMWYTCKKGYVQIGL